MKTNKDLKAKHLGNSVKGPEKAAYTPTPWFLVTNTPGVDIRHKIDEQELILVENVNYQIANKIVRAVNSHEQLLRALRVAQRQLAEHDTRLSVVDHAIEQAEGK